MRYKKSSSREEPQKKKIGATRTTVASEAFVSVQLSVLVEGFMKPFYGFRGREKNAESKRTITT